MTTLSTQQRSRLLLGTLLAVMLIGASLATALEVGEQAPDFTLRSTMGEDISLSQFRGKQLVLIEFFISATSTTGT